MTWKVELSVDSLNVHDTYLHGVAGTLEDMFRIKNDLNKLINSEINGIKFKKAKCEVCEVGRNSYIHKCK